MLSLRAALFACSHARTGETQGLLDHNAGSRSVFLFTQSWEHQPLRFLQTQEQIKQLVDEMARACQSFWLYPQEHFRLTTA